MATATFNHCLIPELVLNQYVYYNTTPNEQPAPQTVEAEDIEPMDTSFFGVDRFAEDVCEKNLREAINGASSKADACRRIMRADACGYIHIRQYTDARKAELINPYAMPKLTFTGDDFAKARCRRTKQ